MRSRPVLALLVLAAACGEGFESADVGPIPPGGDAAPGAARCAPEERQACVCPDGRPGAQTCRPDLSGWGACACDGEPDPRDQGVPDGPDRGSPPPPRDAGPPPPPRDSGPPPPPPGCAMDLTAGDPAAWASGGDNGPHTQISADRADPYAGADSLRAQTDAGFDWFLRYPGGGGARWDLTGFDRLAFAIRGQNDNDPAWQGEFPVVVLEDVDGGRLTYSPAGNLIPAAGWAELEVPLAGGAGWTRAGAAERSAVAALEIHADTWGAGFTIGLDALRFERADGSCEAPCGPCPDDAACEVVRGLPTCAHAGGGCEPATRAYKVLVVSYDPLIQREGGRRLSARWNDPAPITDRLRDALCEASEGNAAYEIVDFVRLDRFPPMRDGTRLDEARYFQILEAGRWDGGPQISYAGIFAENDLVRRVQAEQIHEVWLWGAPWFGYDEFAYKHPGDQVYFDTDNVWFYRPYDLPDVGRTIWVMGFNYERQLGEAIHSYGHRVESMLAMTVGQGIWDHARTPENPWNRLTRVDREFPGRAEVGNVHYPPNGAQDYDYGNARRVSSTAARWPTWPAGDQPAVQVDAEAWGGPDYQTAYLKWWLNHLPRTDGLHEGTYRNWWAYIVDFDDAVRRNPPPGGSLRRARVGRF